MSLVEIAKIGDDPLGVTEAIAQGQSLLHRPKGLVGLTSLEEARSQVTVRDWQVRVGTAALELVDID